MGNCFSHISKFRVPPDQKLTTLAMEKSSSKKNTQTEGQEVVNQAMEKEADTKPTKTQVAPADTSHTPTPAPISRRKPAASQQILPRLPRSDAAIDNMKFGPALAAASSQLSAATMLSIDPVAPSPQQAHNSFASTRTEPAPVLLPGYPFGSGTYISSGMMPGMQPAYNAFASSPYAGYPFSSVLNNSGSISSGGAGMSGQPSSSFSAFGKPSGQGYYTSSRLSAGNSSDFDHMVQEQKASPQSSNILRQSSEISSSSSLATSNSARLKGTLAEAQSYLAEMRARVSAPPPAFISFPEKGAGSSTLGSMMQPPRRRAIFERDPMAALGIDPPARYSQVFDVPSRDRQRRVYQGFVSIVTITEGICGVDEDWGAEYLPQAGMHFFWGSRYIPWKRELIFCNSHRGAS
jgi:hypothetical protein